MNLRSKLFTFFLFVVSVCTGFAGATEQDQFPFTGEVTTTKLNVRALPKVSKDSQVIKVLTLGKEIEVIGEKDGFYRISAPEGTFLWIYQSNAKKEGTEIVVTSDNAPLRMDSRINALQAGTAKNGQKLKVSGEYLGWYKVTPPEDVSFYVSKKYVRKTRELTKGKIDPSKSQEAMCQSKLQEADYLIKKQHELISQNKIKEVSFNGIISAYEEAGKYSGDKSTKKFAEENARRFKDLQNLLIGLKANISIWETQSQKANELLSALEKLSTKKTYTYIGMLDTVGMISDRPAEFKLVDGTRTKCFIKFKENDPGNSKKVLNFYKKTVGIIGSITWDDNWKDIPVVIVDTMDEIPADANVVEESE